MLGLLRTECSVQVVGGWGRGGDGWARPPAAERKPRGHVCLFSPWAGPQQGPRARLTGIRSLGGSARVHLRAEACAGGGRPSRVLLLPLAPASAAGPACPRERPRCSLTLHSASPFPPLPPWPHCAIVAVWMRRVPHACGAPARQAPSVAPRRMEAKPPRAPRAGRPLSGLHLALVPSRPLPVPRLLPMGLEAENHGLPFTAHLLASQHPPAQGCTGVRALPSRSESPAGSELGSPGKRQ